MSDSSARLRVIRVAGKESFFTEDAKCCLVRPSATGQGGLVGRSYLVHPGGFFFLRRTFILEFGFFR